MPFLAQSPPQLLVFIGRPGQPRREHLAGGEIVDCQAECVADRHDEFQVVWRGLPLLGIHFQMQHAHGMAALPDGRRDARHPPAVWRCRARKHRLVGSEDGRDHAG